MPKVVAIVQGRMGSHRLPGKVLRDIAGQPMLLRVVRRLQGAHLVERVVVATSDANADDAIATLCEQQQIACFRGSENDVLDRYYQAATAFHATNIVRITADCPLLDAAVVDRVVARFLASGCAYVSNIAPPTFPDGLDVEAFTFAALRQAWHEAVLPSEREHVTPYLRNNPQHFSQSCVANTRDLSSLRWTVDQPEDLAFVRSVYHALNRSDFTMDDVCELLCAHPHLARANSSIPRNEGYLKSLLADFHTLERKVA